MTLLEVEELTRYWIEHPPLHVMVAACLGLHHAGKIRRKAAAPSSRNPDPNSLLAELGPGFGSGDVHTGLAPVVLDFVALRRSAKSIGF